MANNIHRDIGIEESQLAATRQKYFKEIEKQFDGRALVTFFTSFRQPVSLDDNDCDTLQSMFKHMDTSKGIVLMINTPGGDGLAAERIVNTCRAYSGTGDYWVVVPGKAKSAGTVICMGASRIYMAASSELGPVDPQIFRIENGVQKTFSAYGLVSGYEKLFANAVKAKGNLEPYMQQLQRYDDRDINRYRDLINLSESITIKILRSGMMKGKTASAIKKSVGIFLDPKQGTISHGRPITREECRNCSLVIKDLDVLSPQWKPIYELYARTERFVTVHASKAIESHEESFYSGIPSRGEE